MVIGNFVGEVNWGVDFLPPILPLCYGIIMFAAEGIGDVSTIQLLIESGADINAKDNQGNTPLHMAVALYRGDKETKDITNHIRHLIKSGADINITNNDGLTPLHLAGKEGYHRYARQDLAKLLIESGADVNTKDYQGNTLLDIVRK